MPKPQKQNVPFAFVYIPKTSGTYLNIKSIPDKSFFVKDYEPFNWPSEFHMTTSKIVSIVGENCPLFTLVRDPYDRTCSEYFFIKKETNRLFGDVPWNMKDPKKIQWVAYGAQRLMGHRAFFEKVYNIYSNEMSVEDYLEWTTQNPTYPIFYDFKTPKDFDLVGQTENIEKTIYLLKKIYNVDAGNGKNNQNIKKDVGKPYQTNYLRLDFERKNKIEYDLYKEGIEKFNTIFKDYEKR